MRVTVGIRWVHAVRVRRTEFNVLNYRIFPRETIIIAIGTEENTRSGVKPTVLELITAQLEARSLM